MVAIQLRVGPVASRLGDTARFWALEVTCGFFLALRRMDREDGKAERRTDRKGHGGVRASDER
jgi:hypothetical protein